MARPYRHVSDGEEVSLACGVRIEPGRGIAVGKIMCCDCGLVHVHAYRLTKRGTLKMRTWRDMKATAARRRRKT